MNMTPLEIGVIFSMLFGIFAGCGIVLNIYFIVTKHSLHVPMYYLLINVGFAEIIFYLNNTMLYAYWKYYGVNITSTGDQNKFRYSAVFIFISQITYLVSICTLMLMSVDRFIAIRYCLRYHQMVTKIKIVTLCAATWIFSVGARSIPLFCHCRSTDVLQRVLPRRKLDSGKVVWAIVLLFCVVMLALTKYTKKIRRDHTTSIVRRQKYFGVQAQQLTILRRLKQSLHDTLRLNYVGLAFVFMNFVGHLFFNYVHSWFYKPLALIMTIYMILNPLIFTYTMTDLRKLHVKTLKKIFPFLRRNSVGIEITQTRKYSRTMSTHISEFDLSTHYISGSNNSSLEDAHAQEMRTRKQTINYHQRNPLILPSSTPKLVRQISTSQTVTSAPQVSEEERRVRFEPELIPCKIMVEKS